MPNNVYFTGYSAQAGTGDGDGSHPEDYTVLPNDPGNPDGWTTINDGDNIFFLQMYAQFGNDPINGIGGGTAYGDLEIDMSVDLEGVSFQDVLVHAGGNASDFSMGGSGGTITVEDGGALGSNFTPDGNSLTMTGSAYAQFPGGTTFNALTLTAFSGLLDLGGTDSYVSGAASIAGDGGTIGGGGTLHFNGGSISDLTGTVTFPTGLDSQGTLTFTGATTINLGDEASTGVVTGTIDLAPGSTTSFVGLGGESFPSDATGLILSDGGQATFAFCANNYDDGYNTATSPVRSQRDRTRFWRVR